MPSSGSMPSSDGTGDAMRRPTVIAIVGPTASGKTGLSIRLAEQLNAEIIACDSRTVYREFDIGTAKPTAEEQARVKHHTIDVAEPTEYYTVARFAEDGAAAIGSIISRGKLPIVAGGTGFYARALLEGLVMPSVQPDQAFRDEMEAFANREGNEALHAKLAQIDPLTSSRLMVNDRFRIIRALEVHASTGQPMSKLARREEPPYKTVWIGLNAADRSFIHRSIRKRLDEQMAAGMYEETQRLYEKYGAHQKMLATVNYKQLVPVIEGKADLASAVELAAHHNVQLARRQLIWFRANPHIRWFEIDTQPPEQLTAAVLAYIEAQLR